jgi:transposase
LPLPLNAPELNPVEHIWDDLREKQFHNRVFDSLDALENQLVSALSAYENNAKRVASITGWQWIINALPNY